MSGKATYRHTQHAPLCYLLYAISAVMFGVAWFVRGEPILSWLFPILTVLMVLFGTSFHHLTVEDEGDGLLIAFGPLPLFRRRIAYNRITRAEIGRTTFIDGWGIHLSLAGGWVWNIWGRDCVVLSLQRGRLAIGSDDAPRLAEFINTQISESQS